MLLTPRPSNGPQLPDGITPPASPPRADSPTRATSAVREERTARKQGEARKEREVRKELLHLSREDSVLLRGWERLGDGEFSVSARWPASVFRPVPGGQGVTHESTIVAQTIRQAGLLLAHAEFGAPLDHAVVLRTFDFALEAEGAAALGAQGGAVAGPQGGAVAGPQGGAAIDLALRVSCVRTASRGKRLTGVRLEMDIRSRDGETVGWGATDFEWIVPAVYRRLRGDHAAPVHEQPPLPTPLPPHQVGRTSETEVVLAPTAEPLTWELRSDFSHTVLYDHAVDHAPGLALIEAAHQAAFRTAQLADGIGTFLPRAVRTSFARYVEFDAPCWITAEVLADEETVGPDKACVRIRVTGRQGDKVAFTSELEGTGGEGGKD